MHEVKKKVEVKKINLLTILFVQQRGKKTLLSLTLICHCHLVGMAKIVRGSAFGYDHETPLLDDLADLLQFIWYCNSFPCSS